MRLIKRYKAYFIIFLLIFFFASVYWQYTEEKAVVPEISYYDVLENSTLVVLGEYPEKPPTFAVRVFRLLLFVMGILLFGYIVGSISSIFVVERILTEKISTKFKDHIVICNWNKNGPQILSQISKIHRRNIQVAIISSNCNKNLEIQSYKNLLITVYNNLDPTHYKDLKKINVTQAKAIILLSDEGCENPDGKNALIALAIKCIETKEKELDIHVVAETNNVSMAEHLQHAGADETISHNKLISGILAQTSMFQGISEIYKRLLNYSDSTNEIYFIEKFPEEFCKAQSFSVLSKLVAISADIKNPAILLGIKNKTGIVLNPKNSDFTPISPEDELIVMAYKEVKKLSYHSDISAYNNSDTNKQYQSVLYEDNNNLTTKDKSVIICNWNNHAHRIVDEIQKVNPKITIVAPDCNYTLNENNNLIDIKKKRATKTLLKSLLSKPVKSVLLLANQKSSDPDADNALTALTIHKIDPTIRITAELTNHNMKNNLLKAGINEAVCSNTFIGGMIAQTALNKGMSYVYKRLLEYGDDSNEIYFISEFPDSFSSINSFANLAEQVALSASDEYPLILLGIKYGVEENGIILNPKQSAFKPITSNDQLIVMSYKNILKITT